MKSNKGFTLIELLAIIVILAIIALIATPLIINVIDDARKGAEKSSAYAYIRALEQDVTLEMALGTTEYNEDAKAVGKTFVMSTVVTDLVKTGTPKSVTLTVSNGVVTGGTITVDQYTFSYDGKELTAQ